MTTRYFYDTEFIEDGRTIDLVSIGVVNERGDREYYAVSTEFDPARAIPWVRRNVLDKLPPPSSPDQPVSHMLRREDAHELRKGLSSLKPLDRDTLIAFYFEGRSLKELSARYDSPVGTIKRRLHTARGRLKAVLGEFQPA